MTKITKAELQELRKKAAKWDAHVESHKRGNATRTPEQRKASAKKAAATRWEKYRATKLETAVVNPDEALEVRRRIEAADAEESAEIDAFFKRHEAFKQGSKK